MDHAGLPVPGYRPQSDAALAMVKGNKEIEERMLRILDDLAALTDIDKGWLATGRTDIEKGFMAINRAIMQPGRVVLPAGSVETGWVLERADSPTSAPLYYAPARGGHGGQWTNDHRRALRLSRRGDAVALADALGIECRVAEHQWS